MSKSNVNIQNKKAWHDYEILDRVEAGIQLMGTEIKSIRAGKAGLVDSYCVFEVEQLYVVGMHVAEYSFGSYYNHAAKRTRKLLLHRRELDRLAVKVKNTGLTLVPLRLYINDKGLAKLEIALAKGKKSYDKRDSLKQKDDKREMDRAMKEFR